MNCDVGYEFWLGEQAVARNPAIKLVALPWAAPGLDRRRELLVPGHDRTTTSRGCAARKGTACRSRYLGGWNERGHDSGWYKQLRTSLDAAGFGSVKIVGDDSGWGMADEFGADPALKNAVSVLGNHYVCGYLSQADSCSVTANARVSGKPLWASEFGSQDDNDGVVPYIRTITRGYLDAELTGFLNWPLIAALTPNLPYATVGLMDAGSPWSGSYRVGKNLWANAHVAQFAQPGWQFLNDSASGYLGGSRANGSYVSLTSGSDYSTVYETSGATTAQTVDVRVAGGLSAGTVHVWSTDMGSNNTADYFVPLPGRHAVRWRLLADVAAEPHLLGHHHDRAGQGHGDFTCHQRARAARTRTTTTAIPYAGWPSTSRPCRARTRSATVPPGGPGGACSRSRRSSRSTGRTTATRTAWSAIRPGRTTRSAPTWTCSRPGTVTLLGRANTQNRPQGHQAAYQLRISDTGRLVDRPQQQRRHPHHPVVRHTRGPGPQHVAQDRADPSPATGSPPPSTARPSAASTTRRSPRDRSASASSATRRTNSTTSVSPRPPTGDLGGVLKGRESGPLRGRPGRQHRAGPAGLHRRELPAVDLDTHRTTPGVRGEVS